MQGVMAAAAWQSFLFASVVVGPSRGTASAGLEDERALEPRGGGFRVGLNCRDYLNNWVPIF